MNLEVAPAPCDGCERRARCAIEHVACSRFRDWLLGFEPDDPARPRERKKRGQPPRQRPAERGLDLRPLDGRDDDLTESAPC